MSILVHKAVEPDNLSVKGKKRYSALIQDLIGGQERAIVQPKHDGVYAQVNYDAKRGWAAFSRTGQPLLSVGRDILEVFEAKALPDRAYNGELWLPSTQHSVINGKARKQSPQYLELVLFDSFGQDAEPYGERTEYLFQGGPVKPVLRLPVSSKIFIETDLYDLAREITTRASAYDGLMLKDAEGLYVPGHGKDGESIKIKPRKTGDFRVVGTTPGEGNRKGGTGALVLDLGGGITSEVGTGLSMADVFDREFIGKIVEVEYLGVTDAGRLREPSYIRIRDDKTEADVLPSNVGQED